MMRMALEESGIRVQIEGELRQGAVGELPIGWVTAPRILVEESQIAEARQIIKDLEVERGAGSNKDEQEEATTRCLGCGKEMAEGETTCRTCGWSYLRKE